MDNIKNDNYYIKKVLDNIDAIIKYTKDLCFDEFINDALVIDAVMFRLIQMTENISHISREFKEKHINIEWGKIAGFRNGIVHDYGKTDFTIVYEIVSNDVYKLKTEFLK